MLYLLSDKILSINDLSDVHTKLYDARAKWFDIGLALNISHGTLESIRSEQCSNGDCLREMLAHRMQSGGDLTWADLCCCLRIPAVGRNDLTIEIRPRFVSVFLRK